MGHLISRKASDLGQRFTRVPRARVALVAGLAVAALLGGTAVGAQASTKPSPAAVKAAAPAVSCAGDAIIDEHHGTLLYSYVPGNGNVNLYFDNSGAATYFCLEPVYASTGIVVADQLYANGTNVCLAVDSSTVSIHEASATACYDGASYTLWQLSGTSDPAYDLYKSSYNNECIYDNTQRPATYSGCDSSNQFEWLTVP
jgi:hypothetical protein